MAKEVNTVQKGTALEENNVKRNLWMFPLGTIGRDMVYNLITNFLLTFILFTKGLTTAQLAAITAIMVAARVFDALNDPIMGNIIENTHTRWGKFKPWLVSGILLTSVVVTMVFASTLTGWNFVILFGVFYFCFSITYTMHDISYWGMVPALSSDANARNQFTSRATLCAGIGGTLASIVIPILTAGEFTIGGSATTAYAVIAIVISILSPLFLCFTIFGAKERREPPKPKTKNGLGLSKIVATLKNNDQLRWIFLIFVIQQIGNGIVIGGIGSTYIYFEFGYSGGLYSLFTTVGMSATAVLMVFYPAISRVIHRKPLMTLMMIVSTVGYALMLLSRVVPEGMAFAILVIGYMLSNFGQYCFYLVMMISVMNTVEYNEYKTGARDEAIIGSLRPFVTKLASALIVIITNVSYTIFNVTSYTNRISDLEQSYSRKAITEEAKLASIAEVISEVQGSQTLGLLLCMSILPWTFMLVSYFIYRKKYNLDEAEYERICNSIAEKKGTAE